MDPQINSKFQNCCRSKPINTYIIKQIVKKQTNSDFIYKTFKLLCCDYCQDYYCSCSHVVLWRINLDWKYLNPPPLYHFSSTQSQLDNQVTEHFTHLSHTHNLFDVNINYDFMKYILRYETFQVILKL